MKITWIKTAMLSLAAILLISFSSCLPDDPAPTEEELFLDQLSSTWTLESAMVDTKNVSSHFPNLTLTYSGSYTYQVANAVTGIWPAEGTFTLEPAGDGNFNVKRSDGLLIMVTEITTTTLKLSFQYSAPGGRTSGISGQYVFTFKK